MEHLNINYNPTAEQRASLLWRAAFGRWASSGIRNCAATENILLYNTPFGRPGVISKNLKENRKCATKHITSL